jgi:site-specific recombinase XerD
MTATALATIQPAAVVPAEHATALARYAVQARGAFASNTERAVQSDTRIFSAWCEEAGHSALPASPEVVAAFLDAQAGKGKAPATLRRYVASIAHLHRAAGAESPTKAEAVRLAMKRLQRAQGSQQRQAQGITRRDAELLLQAARDGAAGLRDVALLLVMRDALLRRSEVVALDVADLTTGEDGAGTVRIRRSKTDQEGQGAVQWLSPGTVAAVRAWLTAAGIEAGAIFRPVHRSGFIGDRLDGGEVARILKAMAKRAGIDPATISGHSARIGMAQDLVAAGAELPAVMQAGRWKSAAMPARYAEHLVAARGAVAKLYGYR